MRWGVDKGADGGFISMDLKSPIPGIALLSPVGLVFPVKPGTKRRTKDLEERCRKGKRG